jgi:hypothetical protein
MAGEVLGIDEGEYHGRFAGIRTSADHGTAFDIAGTGKADERSLLAHSSRPRISFIVEPSSEFAAGSNDLPDCERRWSLPDGALPSLSPPS